MTICNVVHASILLLIAATDLACRTTNSPYVAAATVAHPPAADAACATQLDWCTKAPTTLTDTSYVLCIDARGPIPLRYPSASDATGTETLIPANAAIDIKLVFSKKAYKDVSIKLSGAAGHTTPLTGGSPADVLAAKADSGRALRPAVDWDETLREDVLCGVAEARYAPRTPGVVVLSISTTKADKADPQVDMREGEIMAKSVFEDKNGPDVQTLPVVVINSSNNAGGGGVVAAESAKLYDLEFLVPKIYSGALRVGIAGVGFATNHGYGLRKRMGATVSEIIDLGQSAVDPEVVVGYALFPQALTRSDGRDYVRRYNWWAFPKRWGLYAGIGVIGAPGSGASYKAEFFRSLHLGLEYEIAENLSVAVTGVLRRRDELADGYHVGDPMDDGTHVMTTKFGVGMGVVVNFSIDFFRFAGTVGK